MNKKSSALLVLLFVSFLLPGCASYKQLEGLNKFTASSYIKEIMRSEEYSSNPVRIPKIIHLSDIHVGSDYCTKSFESCSRLMDELKNKLIHWSRSIRVKDYIIVITGDLVDRSLPQQDYRNMNLAKQMFEQLEKHFGRVLVVPGNHDLKVKRRYNLRPSTDRAFKKIFYGNDNAEKLFPKVDLIDGVAFIGLNSMQGSIGKVYADYYDVLDMGNSQPVLLQELIDNKASYGLEDKKIILYFHHPLEESEYRSEQQHNFIKLIKGYKQTGQISAILSGHKHNDPVQTGWTGVLDHNAGSTTGKNRFNMGVIKLIDLERHLIHKLELK